MSLSLSLDSSLDSLPTVFGSMVHLPSGSIAVLSSQSNRCSTKALSTVQGLAARNYSAPAVDERQWQKLEDQLEILWDTVDQALFCKIVHVFPIAAPSAVSHFPIAHPSAVSFSPPRELEQAMTSAPRHIAATSSLAPAQQAPITEATTPAPKPKFQLSEERRKHLEWVMSVVIDPMNPPFQDQDLT